MAGVPMLPPTSVLRPPAAMNFAGERRGRGLAVRAGDGDDAAFQKARCQFDFADDRNAARARMDELRHVERHARADDDEVLIAEGALAVLAGFDADAVIEQHRNFLAQKLRGLGVGDGNVRAARLQEQSAGHAGLAQSDHQHAFAFNVHHLILCRFRRHKARRCDCVYVYLRRL